jgi:hypothetical protein
MSAECHFLPTSFQSAETNAQCYTRNANLGGWQVTGWVFAG